MKQKHVLATVRLKKDINNKLLLIAQDKFVMLVDRYIATDSIENDFFSFYGKIYDIAVRDKKGNLSLVDFYTQASLEYRAYIYTMFTQSMNAFHKLLYIHHKPVFTFLSDLLEKLSFGTLRLPVHVTQEYMMMHKNYLLNSFEAEDNKVIAPAHIFDFIEKTDDIKNEYVDVAALWKTFSVSTDESKDDPQSPDGESPISSST